jgi:hypothetical protein
MDASGGGGKRRLMDRFKTPPDWLRYFVPWRVLGWINDHTEVCWANVVMWKLYGGHSWWPTRACWENGYDYCGKFKGALPRLGSPDDFTVTFL